MGVITVGIRMRRNEGEKLHFKKCQPIRELEIESHDETRLKSSSKGDDARRQGTI